MANGAYVHEGGAWTPVEACYANVAGVWKTVQGIWTRVSGVWKLVYYTLSAALSTDNLDMSGAVPLMTGPVTCFPTGGVGPFTYHWQYISGNVFIDVNSLTSQTTTFSYNDVSGDYLATYECQVTDSNGILVSSEQLTVTAEAT